MNRFGLAVVAGVFLGLTVAADARLGARPEADVPARSASTPRTARPLAPAHTPSPTTLPVAAQRALIGEYCLTCHDEDHKKG